MASGRKDYWHGMLSQSTILGYPPQGYFHAGAEDIEPLVTTLTLSYTIPAGYNFHLIGFVVSQKMPGFNYFQIYKSVSEYLSIYYDTIFSEYNEKGLMNKFEAGDILKVYVYNLLDDTLHVRYMIRGILEYIGE